MNAPVLSLFDAPAASVLLANAKWFEGTLLGTLATVIAVIAVAAVGVAMFEGRVELKRGLSVVAGCFVLFGAPVISAGLMSLTAGGRVITVTSAPFPANPAIPPQPLPQTPQQPAFDPYAGAAVPNK